LGPVCLGGLARSQGELEAAREFTDWDEADRYTKVLRDFSAAINHPLVEGEVARATAFVRYGRGERSAELLSELERLRAAKDVAGLWAPGFALLGIP
jgi:hypothetical protein